MPHFMVYVCISLLKYLQDYLIKQRVLVPQGCKIQS